MAAFAKNLLRWTSARVVGSPVDPSVTPPPPPAPPVTDTAAQASIAERRKRRMGMTAAPRAGTQLTGPSGVTGAAPTDRRTLLGG